MSAGLQPEIRSGGGPVRFGGLAGGVPEELAGLADGQGYFSTGPWLSAEAASVLLNSAQHRFGKAAALRRPHLAREFSSWGFTDPRGVYTADTRFLRYAVQTAQTTARIEGWYQGKRTSLQLWVGRRWTAVIAGTSARALLAGYESGAGGSMVQLDVAGVEDTASTMAAWAGLGPAWTVAAPAAKVPRQHFERRILDPRTPPPEGADPQLRRMWGEPWFVWVATVGAGRFRRGFVNAGAAGHYLFGLNHDGGVQLAPQSSSVVWHTLRDAVEDARSQNGRS
ncbi:hypothetical protein [Arthrobacter sp. USHLN218]|uniref:hypothetical protein n=1 Tax=Arthrobacter sp. USHLN218 TaxID=3081232 RepID=UPI003018F979